MQTARAFTWPKLAGTFGRTHLPSGPTGTVRFKTLTVQFWLSWAKAESIPQSSASAIAAARGTMWNARVIIGDYLSALSFGGSVPGLDASAASTYSVWT